MLVGGERDRRGPPGTRVRQAVPGRRPCGLGWKGRAPGFRGRFPPAPAPLAIRGGRFPGSLADDQVFGVDVPQAEEQLGTVVEPAADAVEHGGRVLAHHRPVGTVASEGNLAGFREQAAVGIGDDAQDVIGQPPLEQLEDGSDPARALGPDGLPGGLPELPDAHDDVIEVRSDDHGVDPAGVDVRIPTGPRA